MKHQAKKGEEKRNKQGEVRQSDETAAKTIALVADSVSILWRYAIYVALNILRFCFESPLSLWPFFRLALNKIFVHR